MQRSPLPQLQTNLFLDALSPKSRTLLLDQSVEVDLPLRKSLYEADQVPRYAHFLTSGVASVVNAPAMERRWRWA